jgi:hypothetical protein
VLTSSNLKVDNAIPLWLKDVHINIETLFGRSLYRNINVTMMTIIDWLLKLSNKKIPISEILENWGK